MSHIQSNPKSGHDHEFDLSYARAHYEFLLSRFKPWYSSHEAAKLLGRTDQFIRDSIRNGKIAGHVSRARTVKKSATRCSYHIPADALIVFLVESANYHPNHLLFRISDLFKHRSNFELKAILVMLDKLRS